ncbi:MAG TPA: hypothetical protein VMS76_08085 [Planctomycetota bacterium]|nr:hypothetical protein [Planctomycetota bacterium]
MKNSKKSSRPKLTFQHSTRVEIREAPFHPLESLQHLDVKRLAKAKRARFDVGWFETDCCRQMVQAVVEKGRVSALEQEPCDEMDAPESKDLQRLVDSARRRVERKAGKGLRKPMPVAAFLANAASVTVQSITCWKICIFGRCIVCCTTKVPKVPIKCGKKVVILD